MKKLLSFLLTTILACTILSTTACVNSKDENTVYVGILQVATHSALDNAREGFEDTLNEWAQANGKKVEYDRQNANGDSNNEITLADAIVAKNPDLVLGIATSSARALVNASGTIPTFFTAVTAPSEEQIIRENSAGTSDMNPVAEQIALIKEINPETQKIGFLYNSSENNSRIQFELAKEKCSQLNIEIEGFTATQSSDIATVIESIGSDIDAVYLPTDNLMAENVTLICSTLHAKQIPVIGGESGMCGDGGAVATLGIDYYELGVQTAQMAIKVLNKEVEISTLQYELYNKAPSFFINETNALSAGISQSVIDALKAKYAE